MRGKPIKLVGPERFGLHRPISDRFDRLGINRVDAPLLVDMTRNDPGLAQNLEMARERRRRYLGNLPERAGMKRAVLDEALYNREPGLIAQCGEAYSEVFFIFIHC